MAEKKEKKSLTADPWSILVHPMLTEKAIGMVERENKLMFIVSRNATKKQIRWAAEKALEVKVENVNTLIDTSGKKRAIIKLSKEFNAADIATRFGML